MATGLAITDEAVHAILRDWPAITALQTAPEVMIRNHDVDVRDDEQFAWPGRPEIWVSPVTTSPTSHPSGTASLNRFLVYRVRILSPGSLADYRAIEDAVFGALAQLCHYDKTADGISIHYNPPSPWTYRGDSNISNAYIDRADQYGVTAFIDFTIKLIGDTAVLASTIAPAPVPLSGIHYPSARSCIVLTFDRPIAALAAPVASLTNFSFCRGGDIQNTAAIIHLASSVYVAISLDLVTLASCSGGPKLTYLASPATLVGTNGTPVAAFSDFALTPG